MLSQPTRLFILLVYVAGLLCASKLALGTWLPPTSEKGLWFYSGLAAILLGSLLVTPFYAKPVDAISYAVAALVALLSVKIWNSKSYDNFSQDLWLASAIYVAFVLLIAGLAIALKDSKRAELQKMSKSLRLLADTLGGPRFLFSVVFLFALLAFHRRNSREYIVIAVAWPLLVALRPLEVAANTLHAIRTIWSPSPGDEALGEVVGHETPGLVLIREMPGAQCSFGKLLAVPGDDGRPSLAMSLDHVGFAEGQWLRGILLHGTEADRTALSVNSALQQGDLSVAIRISSQEPELGITDAAWTQRNRLLGLVAADSDISRLRVELVRTDLDLAEGRLVEADIGGNRVFYQIINGLTKEEIIQQKNTRGFVRVDARKVGCWDSAKTGFKVVRWLPLPNSPVFLLDTVTPKPEREAIGHVPGTDFPITVDASPLVTHNAAILGILGAGKSFLALELIERILCQKVKVIVLDLTDQYATQLKPFYEEEKEKESLQKLITAGAAGKTNVQQNVEEGGSIENFRTALRDILLEFLKPTESQLLKIINPARFEVWRQDSKPFSGRASMATLTVAEVVRLVAEVILDVLQEQGMTDSPRCCLIFEEAHSLIPEWSAVATEGDRAATNGTAKAILQGRKFGLGCMVITQRTANVTKTILNQCNTMFALRVYDATGMEFLSNYIGVDYANVLSALEDRHAVVFGRAVSCRDPILIKLNQRDMFLQVFRPQPTPNDAAQGL